MDGARPDMSVVIVTWNSRVDLVRCLGALHSPEVSQGLQLETIVVDNASGDGTAEWARQQPNVRVVEPGRNLGYGRANNLGLEMARGRHLLILNPDTVPLPGSLVELISFQDTCPKAGIAAPRLLNPDGSVQMAAFRFPTVTMHFLDLFPLSGWLPGRIRQWIYSSSLNGRYKNEPLASTPFRMDHPLGACILISRQAYREVGGFDPRIFMYSEEIDLALRYARKGWECWQVPGARVVHLGGQSTSQAADKMRQELWRSRLYLYRKHYNLPSQLALSGLLLIREGYGALKLLVGSRLGRVSSEERRRRWQRIREMAEVALGK